ncbi:MAG: hypothetical protein ACLTSG_10410 [Lachnospiraceae bacterium]
MEDEVELGPEMPADRAAKYYAANVSSLKLRFRLALLLSVILCWISFGLPTAGALGHDLKTTSLVCLALELSVVMLGLDIFTKGIMSLVRNRPGLWTLVSFSCVASALDAVVSYAVGTAGWGLPFCGAAALSMSLCHLGRAAHGPGAQALLQGPGAGGGPLLCQRRDRSARRGRGTHQIQTPDHRLAAPLRGAGRS